MKKINKVIVVLSKILELFFCFCAAESTMVIIACLFGKPSFLLRRVMEKVGNGLFVEVFGLTFSVSGATPDVARKLLAILSLITIISVLLVAAVFHCICLLFRISEGKTKYSEGATPFQKANIKLIKIIGYLCIALPVIQLLLGILFATIFKHLNGSWDVDMGVDFISLFFGLIILCLSQFFAYGMRLESDVEGLV